MEVKSERLQRLNAAINEYSRKSNDRSLGSTVEVLVEGVSKNNDSMLSGRTRTNKLVHFEGSIDLIGDFVNVLITDTKTWYIKGDRIPDTIPASDAV